MIYLMENSKETGEVAVIDLDELEEIIKLQKRKLRDLKIVRLRVLGKTGVGSGVYDKESLRRDLGVPYTVLKLVKK